MTQNDGVQLKEATVRVLRCPLIEVSLTVYLQLIYIFHV